MERTCENCKYSCVDSAIAAVFCMGQKNMPRVKPFDTCDDWEPVYRTNGDAIRQMSDKELAKWLSDMHDSVTCPNNGAVDCNPSCKKCWLDWLKQEVESDGVE